MIKFLRDWALWFLLLELGLYWWKSQTLPDITDAVELGVTRALQNQSRGFPMGSSERMDREDNGKASDEGSGSTPD